MVYIGKNPYANQIGRSIQADEIAGSRKCADVHHSVGISHYPGASLQALVENLEQAPGLVDVAVPRALVCRQNFVLRIC
jgi:hypothetical protein